MALHDELLALARELVPEDTRHESPSEASLRRGVSTAYYALFHLVTSETMNCVFADPSLRSKVVRSLEHRRIKSVCEDYSKAASHGSDQFFVKGSNELIPRQLRDIANAFVSLHDERQRADYDTAKAFGYEQANITVMTAEAAFLDWKAIESDRSLFVFLTEIFLRNLIAKR